MNKIDRFPFPVIAGISKSSWFTRLLLITLLCLLATPAVPLWADEPGQNETTAKVVTHPGLRSAREAASTDDSLVLLILEMTGCRNCVRLREETLTAPDFLDKAGSLHVVAININQQQRYASDFQVNKVPDLILMTGEGEIVNRSQGFKDTKALMEMISQARRNKLEGKWFGSDVVNSLDSEKNINELITFLGSANPLLRARAVELLAESNKTIAIPLLIKALTDPYLGIRVGARELLYNWIPNAPEYDPWSDQKSRETQSKKIAAWWQATGSQAQASPESATLNQPQLRSVEEAITVIEQHDPGRLAIATARLREIGKSCLPLLRAAIARNSTADNRETVRILENIRWSIIIPDTLEQTARARHALAWGMGEERLAAIARLSSGCNEATEVLAELADDPDPLVRESVAHALGKIGNKAALEALAELLQSDDPNTRMVAAQELGKTENKLAGPYLSAVVTDPDELVACAAISAMEECKAVDQAAALLATLSDPRWRVRAAGAKALGELEYTNGAAKLTTLLHDEDPFVLKSALEALIELNALPPVEEIEPLFAKYPDLTTTITAALLAKNDQASLEMLTRVFINSTPVVQRDIMVALRNNGLKGDINLWQKLFAAALEGGENLRYPLVQLLEEDCPLDFAGNFLSRLLADPVTKIRDKATRLTLQITTHHWGTSNIWSNALDFNILSPADAAGDDNIQDDESREALRAEVQAKHAQWHELLGRINTDSTSLTSGLAYWLTANNTEGLEQLPTILQGEISSADQELMVDENLAALIIKRLPWPAGRPFLDAARQYPHFLITLTQAAPHSSNRELQDHLNEPQQLIALFQGPADGHTRHVIASVLSNSSSSLFLAVDTKRNRFMLDNMIKSGAPWAKALALLCLAHFAGEESQQVFEESLADPDQWVRYAAVQALILQKPGQERLETLLAPLLHDPSSETATMAAVGLVDPFLFDLMGFKEFIYEYRYDGLEVSFLSFSTYFDEIQRPFTTFERTPRFIDELLEKLLFPDKLTKRQKYIYPILIGQYGVLNAIKATLRNWEISRDKELQNFLLMAPQFSSDEDFLEPLKDAARQASNRSDLRDLLKYLRTTPGEAARNLRRDINRRIQSQK